MTDTARDEGLLYRTLRGLRARWLDIAILNRTNGDVAVATDLSESDVQRVKTQMRECLEALGGEISARARAASLGRTYLSLGAEGRIKFLKLLTEEFDCEAAAVDAAIAKLAAATDKAQRRAAERNLRAALEPPRRRLLTQFNALPEGVKFLVDLRAEIARLARQERALLPLEADLKELLASWFDVDFLDLRRITWQSPASILEKLIAYEAVHEIHGWDDLRNRLDSDRRCFAFFHPRMPEEPLIFVEVAFTTGLADSIQALLDTTAPVIDPRTADTAIFYSISNTQSGLAGISFGGFLIKRVVDALTAELPNLRHFATLSPIPGFRAWLDQRLGTGEAYVLSAPERKALAAAATNGADRNLAARLADPAWIHDAAACEALKKPLLRLCARYLMEEKRSDGRALDPVANFHLSNGARLERLNWRADISAKGIEQSAGLMINYLYRIDDIPGNHESYASEGRIPAGAAMRSLIKT